MALYAIRQKSTGYFMPLRYTRKGNTHSTPAAGVIPRLFKTKQQASSALTWWLKGAIRYQEYFDQTSLSVDYKLETTPLPQRQAEDMEIIQVEVRPL